MPLEKEFRQLTVKMENAGLFETRYSDYLPRVVFLSMLLAFPVWNIIGGSHSLGSVMLSAASLGFFWQQLSFIGHDAGHIGITHNRTLDSCIGLLVGNLLSGISIAWWKRSHNVHHIVCNSIEHDPDIQHVPVLAMSKVYLQEPVYSSFYKHYLPFTSLSQLLCRYQHLLFYPVMMCAKWNLYAQSWLHLLALGPYHSPEVIWHRRTQLACLAGFATWLAALVSFLPGWPLRLSFLLVSHAVAGILHVQIILSHYTMPVYKGISYNTDKDGFVRTQLATTMDISCPPWMDWFHGGLQFQIEHHLWPRLPRDRLRFARQSILLPFLAKNKIEALEADFITANGIMISKLRAIAQTTVDTKISDCIWDLLFASG